MTKARKWGLGSLFRKYFLITAAALQLIVVALLAYRYSIETPTFHLDGAFQNASSQFRLKSGELPGRDFFPYLGIGPTLLTFPAFQLFGGNLAATVVASRVVTLVTLLVTSALIGYLAGFRDRRLAAGFFSTAALVFYVASLMLPILNSLPGAAAIPIMAEPMNSMRPVRAFLPYILAITALAVFRIRTKPRTKVLSLSIVTGGLCAIWSNDFGLSTVSLCALVGAVTIMSLKTDENRLGLLLLWIVGLVVSALFSLSVATGSQPLSMIAYNFLDVAQDQYWYFAPWGPNTRVNSLLDLALIIWSERAIYPLLVLLAVACIAFKTRGLHYVTLGLIGVSLFGGGLVATIGGHSAGYFLAFTYWGMLTAGGLVFRFGAEWFTRNRYLVAVERAKRLVAPTSVAALIATLGVSSYWVYDTHRDLSHDKNYVFSAIFGGYLDREADEFLKTLRKVKTVEEYYGLYSVASNSFAGVKTDALIHALGSQRQPLLDRLTESPQVITTNPRFSYWASWSLSANWWFYRELFIHYSHFSESSKLVAWSRNSKPRATIKVPCQVDVPNQKITVARGRPGFYEVTVVYKTNHRPSRSYSMVQNNINFASDADGFVALNPRQEQNVFPAFLASADQELAVKTLPDDSGSEFALERCSALEFGGGEELFVSLGYVPRG